MAHGLPVKRRSAIPQEQSTLKALAPDVPVASRPSGHYYWRVDEIDTGRLKPHLGHPTPHTLPNPAFVETKKRMGKTP